MRGELEDTRIRFALLDVVARNHGFKSLRQPKLFQHVLSPISTRRTPYCYRNAGLFDLAGELSEAAHSSHLTYALSEQTVLRGSVSCRLLVGKFAQKMLENIFAFLSFQDDF